MAVFRCQKDCHQGARGIYRRGHSMRVMVYAGRDPLTGKKKWVSRQIPGTGRAALKEAKQIEARLLAEVAAGRHQEAQGSSHALVSRCGSALARRVPLRGGRNARPVSSGPSGPVRGQSGAPAGRQPALGPSQLGGAGGRGGTTLTPGAVGPGGIPRRARASAERGRVQGPGRAEADFGPRTVPVTLFPT